LTFRQVLEWSGPLTISYLARTNCRSWVKRQFAAPTIRGILGVELPGPDMTVPVTVRSFGGWRRNGDSVSFSADGRDLAAKQTDTLATLPGMSPPA